MSQLLSPLGRPWNLGEAPPAGLPDRDIYLRWPAALLLLAGCVLLQVPIYWAARMVVGKNLAVAVALLLGMITPALSFVLWFSPAPGRTLRLRNISPAPAAWIAGASLSFTLLVSGSFELLLRWVNIPENIIRLVEREEILFREVFQLDSALDLITVGFILVIVAPLAEELLFRGILQGSLERSIGNWPGILIASLAFGLLHGQLRLLPVGTLGLLMGYMVMRTNALPAGILAHGVNNFTVLLLSLLFQSRPLATSQLVLISGLGGLGLMFFLIRFRSATSGDDRIIRSVPLEPDLTTPPKWHREPPAGRREMKRE
jgi:membrane protease YdiL (CAAX protease family)